MLRHFIQLRLSILLFATILLFSSNALAVTWTYDPHKDPEKDKDYPDSYDFMAYKGETITFQSWSTDEDKKTDDSCPPNEDIYDAADEVFLQYWTITGKASFHPTTNQTSKFAPGGLKSGNMDVYVDDDFASGDTITVKMELEDHSTNGPPGTDDDDGAYGVSRTATWTITFKTKCPTSLYCTSPDPNTSEYPNMTTYTYRLDDDIGSPGRPDYTGVSIHESFGSLTSNIDQDVHVTQAGRDLGKSDDYWRDYFFDTESYNASGVPDSSDQIYDTHTWGFNDDPDHYLIDPPTSELWCQQPQTYTCKSDNPPDLNQTCTYRRIYKTTGVKKVKKF